MVKLGVIRIRLSSQGVKAPSSPVVTFIFGLYGTTLKKMNLTVFSIRLLVAVKYVLLTQDQEA